MNRNFFLGLLVAALAALWLASPALAQMGPGQAGGHAQRMGPWWTGKGCAGPFWRDQDLVKALNLSKEQIDKLEKAETDFARSRIDLQANVKKALFDFLTIQKEPRADAKKAKQAADAYLQAKRQLLYHQIDQRATVDAILTVEQVTKLKDLAPQRCREGRNLRHPAEDTDEDHDEQL